MSLCQTMLYVQSTTSPFSTFVMDDIIYEFVVSFPLSVGYLIMLQI
jgi:hypothetical protein